MVGAIDLERQCAFGHFLVKDGLGIKAAVVAPHACVVATHNQVGAACVMAEHGVQYCFTGSGVEHVKAIAGHHHRVGGKVQVDHFTDRGVADIRGDIARLQFSQQHVNEYAVGREVLHRHTAQLFVGAVHGVSGLEGDYALPTPLGNLASDRHRGAERVGEVLLKVGVVEHFDRT